MRIVSCATLWPKLIGPTVYQRMQKTRSNLLAILCAPTIAILVLNGTAQVSSAPPQSGRPVPTTGSRLLTTPPPAPAATARNPTLPLGTEGTAPSVPQVTWDGNLLTIITDNATLSDILAAVSARTGAQIDAPANASSERMAARLGPGPAREVMATLLSWTDFNYIIQASDTNPLGIQSVSLSPRHEITGEEIAGIPGVPTVQTPRGERLRRVPDPIASSAETPSSEDSVPAQPVTTAELAPESVQPVPSDSQPALGVLQPTSSVDRQTTGALESGSSEVRTPVQMIQQLQSMYLQRQQLQLQQQVQQSQTP